MTSSLLQMQDTIRSEKLDGLYENFSSNRNNRNKMKGIHTGFQKSDQSFLSEENSLKLNNYLHDINRIGAIKELCETDEKSVSTSVTGNVSRRRTAADLSVHSRSANAGKSEDKPAIRGSISREQALKLANKYRREGSDKDRLNRLKTCMDNVKRVDVNNRRPSRAPARRMTETDISSVKPTEQQRKQDPTKYWTKKQKKVEKRLTKEGKLEIMEGWIELGNNKPAKKEACDNGAFSMWQIVSSSAA